MSIDLTAYADPIDQALAEGVACIVGTIGDDGLPNLGFKGSMMVFDAAHLAYWEYTRRQHLANLRRNRQISVMYFNVSRGAYVRMWGEAALHPDGPIRDQILSRVVPAELKRDPERKGLGVLIRVDRLEEPISGLVQLREAG
jgi:hypothetical protein